MKNAPLCKSLCYCQQVNDCNDFQETNLTAMKTVSKVQAPHLQARNGGCDFINMRLDHKSAKSFNSLAKSSKFFMPMS